MNLAVYFISESNFIMEIENITNELVERTLRNWQQALETPYELLELDLLTETGAVSRVELQIKLYELLTSLVVEPIKSLRKSEGISPLDDATASLIDSIATDFSSGNLELRTWSTLYHRYLATPSLSAEDLATAVHVTPRHIRRFLNTGIGFLVSALQHAEINAHRRIKSVRLQRHLPPPDYVKLFGAEAILRLLVNLLEDPEGPRFISIEGLGGIGKTALAQFTAQRMAELGKLEDIFWISARDELITYQGELKTLDTSIQSLEDILVRLTQQLGQEHLMGLPISEKIEKLRPFLFASPYLIILDNLETIPDHQTLLHTLFPLVGKTRFLITSRHTLSEYAYVHVFSVPELSVEDSQTLIESELERLGRKNSLSQIITKRIYNTIGGLPLALKLVAAQVGRFPLEYILAGLKNARQQMPEQMYIYIYRRTWVCLNDPAKQLLLSMLSVAPDGEDRSWIYGASSLSEEEFDMSLTQLINFSLLEVTGSLDRPVYRIHRLTDTFLRTDILLNWH